MSLTDYMEPRPGSKPRDGHGPNFIQFEIWEEYKGHFIVFHPIQGFSVARPDLQVNLMAWGRANLEEARAYIDKLPPVLTLGELMRDRIHKPWLSRA